MEPSVLWKRYKKHLTKCPGLGINLDISRMNFEDSFFRSMQPQIDKAFEAMDALESGAIANPDEGRMVGHYWLRNADIAPNAEIKNEINDTFADVMNFVSKVHKKEIIPPNAARYTDVLSIGIGGSALGPQLISDALGTHRDKLKLHFMDNTDIDGMHRVIKSLGARLKSTLVLVISKSGGTPEPRNSMLEARAAFERAGLDFAKQAVAITGKDSHLDKIAVKENWIKRFPMWDWVGGRTSVMATVGLVPCGLQGIDMKSLLDGAAKMDELTRVKDVKKNPAAKLALMWYYATGGKGEKDMVVLPYKDRLLLLSRYLQQLIMESLGKKFDIDGNVVNQGIAVYGNKGSTDQHAFVQQLREGVNNFFATFIVVLQDTARPGRDPEVDVDPDVTSGDYLNGFWQGTRTALYEEGRESMTITCDKMDAKTLGALIALYERATGYYGTLTNINAYHQPGVEAGKKAAATVLELQNEIISFLQSNKGNTFNIDELAAGMGKEDAVESIFHIVEHIAANKRLVKKARSQYSAL
ncbi:Glucose-6-phosphate isomerase [Poriferisphaera corsica]|uniref:Glucose-6-phosphate isomerase n=1 Tax=Poriferisphaera corsica TaxID=2528020 RepID=A0A517YT82_9BACT|nr:glucose-6-phosphate isomerase [Poriferisphaera corsica]QDU33449.1 Glucose-6-phosphate isomerase [Poriferisphaera corsica]